jgi:DNA helicase-2/ATP-dependent DNA helicase PcrA
VSEYRFSAGLNHEQQAAVLHGSGPLLILAGAGTGKTRVITSRIASLIHDRAVDPRQILALTFTNKAASEMKERAIALAGPGAAAATISTFHSACARWLRRYAGLVGRTSSFSIYDEDDQLAMIRTIAERLALPHDASAARSYRHRIEQAHNRALRVDEVQTAARGREGEVFASLFREYEVQLRQNNATDFGDLIASMVHLLQDQPHVRDLFRANYPWVMVDEFQDTNHAQFMLLRELCAADGNICAVGDDDQSIYRWRGASVENLRAFSDHFAGATVALVQNYRSTAPILKAAHDVVSRLPQRMDKTLRTDRTDGEPVGLFVGNDDREECTHVARTIASMRRAGERSWSDFAVFYRTNAQSRGFEESLRAAQVPYRVVGSTSFFDRREVRDVVAYLRLVANPRDDVALRRVINTPPRGIGASTLHQLELHAASRGTESLVMALTDLAGSSRTRIPKKTRAALSEAAVLFTRLCSMGPDAPVDAVMDAVLTETGYEAWMNGQESSDAEDRLANLDELRNAAREFCAREPSPSLTAFLEQVSLTAGPVELSDDDVSQVSLMTVHSSKGLEFPVVFATGLEEETFPLVRRGAVTDDELDEERRLCYVAMTRARDVLVLTAAMRRRVHGQIRWTQPSRFLVELGDAGLSMMQESAVRTVHWRDSSGRQQAAESSVARPVWDDMDQRPWQERDGAIPEAGIVFDDSHFPEHSVQVARGYVGRRARHALFGVGQVVEADPTGEHVRLTILFPDVGTKKVVLKYVELLD